jgi:hypothetical protein
VSGRTRLLLFAIVAAGAALRSWTIGDGLPYVANDDEWRLIDRATSIMRSGHWHPGSFDLGSLTVYLHVFVAATRFLFGAVEGEWSNFGHIWVGPFVQWSRAASALAGVAAIYVLFRAGTRWNTRVALVAAALMAVSPALVRESQIARADSLLLFLIALTLLQSIRAGESGRVRDFALAGAAAGLAASASFAGVLALAVPAGVALVRAGRLHRLAALAIVAGAAAATFVATSPHAIIDLPGFLNSAAVALRDRAPGSIWTGIVSAFGPVASSLAIAPAAWDPLRLSASPGMLLGLIGLATIARDVRSPERWAAAGALFVLMAACGWLALRSGADARSATPLVAVVCLGVAIGVDRAAGRVHAAGRPAARRAVWLLVALMLSSSATRSLAGGWERTKASTAERAADWLLTHGRAGERTVIESPAIRLPPAFTSASTPRLIDRPIDTYRADSVVYLVVRSDAADAYLRDAVRFPAEAAAYQALFAAVDVVERFAPARDRAPGEPTFIVVRLGR